MSKKGLETEVTFNETLDFSNNVDKPLKSEQIQTKKVDINVLKARAQEIQDKENRKNIFIFILFLLILGAVGIYLSI